MRNSQLQLILIFESDLLRGWHKCSKPIITPSEMRPKYSWSFMLKFKVALYINIMFLHS